MDNGIGCRHRRGGESAAENGAPAHCLPERISMHESRRYLSALAQIARRRSELLPEAARICKGCLMRRTFGSPTFQSLGIGKRHAARWQALDAVRSPPSWIAPDRAVV